MSSFGVHVGTFSGPDRDQVVFAKNAPRPGERHYFYVPGSHFITFGTNYRFHVRDVFGIEI